MTAIETGDLTKFFGDFQAVNSVNLSVPRGSLYGFLGPNGAGKSTTIKMLTGILKPSSGSIKLLDGDPWDRDQAIEVKRKIGVVPEDLALFDNLTAREYLTFVGKMHLLDKTTIIDRGEALLRTLRLDGVEKKLAVEYSHGMKKKLALAAALLPNPSLLFLDEPFEGVDVVTARVIRDLLNDYVANGATVFVTSHVMEIVERICTHVGIIIEGRLVEQSSLADLRAQSGSVGHTLENRFVELVGTTDEAAPDLAWLDGGTKSKDIFADDDEGSTSSQDIESENNESETSQ